MSSNDPKKLNLAELTREQKLALVDAIAEKKRRIKEARGAYRPNIGQLEVHQCDKLERYVFSGNGAGKTALLVNEVIWAALGFNPILNTMTRVPSKIVYLLDDPEKIALKIIPEIKKWFVLKPEMCHQEGKPYISMIRFPNGSYIKFLSHGIEPMKAESIELDFMACDEPPPYHLYSSLTRGMREKGSVKRTLIVGTPLASAWLRRDIYDPWTKGELPYVHCFRFQSDVNKENLDWDRQEKYFASLSDKERSIRRDGNFFDLDGLALAHLFKRDTHIIPPPKWPPTWPVVCALDPHPSKAHTALLLGITPTGAYKALKSLSSKLPARQFAKELKEFYRGYRVVDIVCDSLGNSDSTGGDGRLSFIQVLKDEGVRLRATSFDEKNDEAWIAKIQDVLIIPEEANRYGEKIPKLQVSSACIGLIADIESVEWQKFRNIDEYKPKLAIASKDDLSCLKYALAANPQYNKQVSSPLYRAPSVSWSSKEKWRGK